jgi:beta-glucosidase
VNPYLNQSDAFVAAWLPGSEGGGVADVLFGKADFKGKLSFSWPKRADQFSLNVGDAGYDPLFAYGYGLSYAKPGAVGVLSEDSGLASGSDQPAGTWFSKGKTATPFAMQLVSGGANALVTVGPVSTPDGALKTAPFDRNAQEDSRRYIWSGAGMAALQITSPSPIDLSRESNGALAIEIDIRVDAAESTTMMLGQTSDVGPQQGIDIAPKLRTVMGKGWQTLSLPLTCLAKRGVDMKAVVTPFSLSTAGRADISISRIALGSSAVGFISCE